MENSKENKVHKLKEFERVQNNKVRERFGFIFRIIGEMDNIKSCVFFELSVPEELRKISEIKYSDDKNAYAMSIRAEKEMKGKFEKISAAINSDNKVNKIYKPASIFVGDAGGVILKINFDLLGKIDDAMKNNNVLISEIKKIITEEEHFLGKR